MKSFGALARSQLSPCVRCELLTNINHLGFKVPVHSRRIPCVVRKAATPSVARVMPQVVRFMNSTAAEPALKAEPLMDNAVSNLSSLHYHTFGHHRLTSSKHLQMFCYQCEQRSGDGCTKVGVCGKTPEVGIISSTFFFSHRPNSLSTTTTPPPPLQIALLQDLLVYSLKGLSCWAHYAVEKDVPLPPHLTTYLHSATFSTLTNVNFDAHAFRAYIAEAHALRDSVEQALQAAGISDPPPAPAGLPWFDLLAHPAQWHLSTSYLSSATEEQLVNIGKLVSLEHRRHLIDPTLLGLHEMLSYGLRGLAAYTHHAEVLGARVPEADAFIVEGYAFLCSDKATDINNVLGMIMKCGEVNLATMKGLSDGHRARFGIPEPSPVKLTPTAGKAILISGHDMGDLHDLLMQTEGTGINVYTHGEMLPAHGYPALKKFSHLVGNYGGAWFRQGKEFASFPGAILMTSNCIVEPRPDYADRIFTTGEVGFPGTPHIAYAEGGIGSTKAKDYSAVIAKALDTPGFTEEDVSKAEAKTAQKSVLTGFGHEAILGVADQVVDAVKSGKLSHIFLVGGCDGAEPDRRYFSKVADEAPEDTLLLTLGCGKFRFYDHENLQGNLPGTGLPRLLDIGQCNDAHSALVVASALADAFETDVNGLPLSLDLSWLEQKAVVILLSLLSLGVKNIRIGPKPPAFVTPEALSVLVDKFSLKVTNVKDPAGDVAAMMAGN